MFLSACCSCLGTWRILLSSFSRHLVFILPALHHCGTLPLHCVSHQLHPTCILFLYLFHTFITEDCYNSTFGYIESHVDDAGFQLVNLDLPPWYINSETKTAFASRDSWNSVVSDAPLHVASDLASVLSSSQSPSLDFFRRLPKPPVELLSLTAL